MTINVFDVMKRVQSKRFKPINNANCMVKITYVRSQSEQDRWRKKQAGEKMLQGQNVNIPSYSGTGMAYRLPK